MHDAAAMSGVKRAADLLQDLNGLRQRQGFL